MRSPLLLIFLLHVATGCTPTRLAVVDWSPAVVDSMRAHPNTVIKLRNERPTALVDARIEQDFLRLRTSVDSSWRSVDPYSELEFFVTPGGLERRTGQGALLGALIGGVAFRIAAGRSVAHCDEPPGCGFTAPTMAKASGLMLGALLGSLTGVLVGGTPRKSWRKYVLTGSEVS